MAKEAWCTVAPTSGNGNKTIAISASAHTGRTARTTAVTVQNQNGAKPSKSIVVNQAARELFITKTSGPVPNSLPVGGGTVIITGKSNAKMIAPLEDTGDWLIASELRVNGQLQTDKTDDPVNPYYVIAGDPGASGEYTFELKATLSESWEVVPRTLKLRVRGYNQDEPGADGVYFEDNIGQAGATSILSTDKESLLLTTAGTTQNVALTSNDSWVIS